MAAALSVISSLREAPAQDGGVEAKGASANAGGVWAKAQGGALELSPCGTSTWFEHGEGGWGMLSRETRIFLRDGPENRPQTG